MVLDAVMAEDFVHFCDAVGTDQGSAAAQQIRTIVVLAGGGGTHVTRAQDFGLGAVIQLKTTIEDVQRTFPQSAIFELLGVTNDASIDLVHLFEATVLHDER